MLSERMKRALIAILFVMIVIGIGIGIYVTFFKSSAPTTTEPTPSGQIGTSSTGALPSSGNAGTRPATGSSDSNGGTLPTSEQILDQTPATTQEPTTVILKEAVVQQLTISTDGKEARYYDPITGKFYKINPDGAEVQLGTKSFPNVETVDWGHSSDQAILTYPDGTNIHVNFETGKQETLPKHWEDFSFSPDDKNVTAKTITTSPESRYLVISDPNGKNTRVIEPLGENDDQTYSAWTPNNQIIAYATVGEAVGFDREEIILVGKNHENFKALLVEGRGFEPLWSPSGDWMLYSAWNLSNGYRPELWVSGGSPGNLNENRQRLKLQTWASKCAWYQNTIIYCAVPDSLTEGAGLDPDSNKYASQDSIVKINLEDGSILNLGKPDGNPIIKNPVVTTDGQNLMYTDASTGYLYAYRLP